MTARALIGLWLVAWSGGCAAPLGPSIAHDETQLFRAPYFDWARLKAGGVAVLGVTSAVAPEGIREDVAFVLDQAASNHLARVRVISGAEAAARAREVGMGEDLARLMRDYEERGSIDAGLLRRFAAVQGVRYFLVTRIAQYDRITRAVSGPPTLTVAPGVASPKRGSERVQRVRLRSDLWDSRCGEIVWTGEGGTEAVEETATEDIRLQDVLSMAATNLVSRLPRPGEDATSAGKECGA